MPDKIDSTVIVGKLDFSELETQIKSLTDSVDAQLKKLAGKFQTHFGEIQKTVTDAATAIKAANDKINNATSGSGKGGSTANADRKAWMLDYERTLRSAAQGIDAMEAKVQKLQALMASSEGKEFLSVSKILQTENEIDKLNEKISRLVKGMVDAHVAVYKVFNTSGNTNFGQRVNDMFKPNETLRQMAEYYRQIQREIAQSTGQKSFFESAYAKADINTKRYDISTIQMLRMEMHQLQAEMQAIERVNFSRGSAEMKRWANDVENMRNRMAQINEEIKRLGSDKGGAQANRGAIQQLQQEYKNLEASISRIQSKDFLRFQELSTDLEKARTRMSELNREIERLKGLKFDSKADTLANEQKIKELTADYKQLRNAIKEMVAEQKQIIGDPTGAAGQRMAQLKQGYQNVLASLREYEQQLVRAEQLEQRVAAAAKQVSETYSKRKGTATFTDSSGQTRTVQAQSEEAAMAQVLKIEKELLETEKQRAETANQIARASSEQKTPRAWQPNDTLTPEQIKQYEQAREREYAALEKQIAGTRELTAAQREQANVQQQAQAKRQPDMTTRIEQQIARLTQYSREEILATTNSSLSYNRLTQSVRQMTAAYNAMDSELRKSDVGQAMLQKLQAASREAQKLQQELSRPTNLKSTMGLSEKTLDDIVYKIKQLQSFKMGLDLTKDAEQIKKVDAELNRLMQRQNQVMGNNKKLSSSNMALARSFAYIRNRLAYTISMYASMGLVRQIIDIRSQYEMLERSIGILVDSAKQGTRIFNELNAMAMKSPFTTIELGTAAKQLSAYDIAANEIVDTTKRLGDMAAAVGIPIERLTYALGQIKAYGYLNARDARMFSNAGIPLVRELADHYTRLEGRMVSVSDVYDRIKKKAIGMEDVLSVMRDMTDEGGKFYNFQEKLAGTLRVQMANLTLAWNNFLNDVGSSNQGILVWFIQALKDALIAWRSIEKAVMSVGVGYATLKGLQMIMNTTLVKSVALSKQVATTQQFGYMKSAAQLRKMTAAEMELYRAELKENLGKMSLTQTEARLIALRQRHNYVLLQQLVNMGLITQEEAEQAFATGALAAQYKELGVVGQAAGTKIKASFAGVFGKGWIAILTIAVTLLAELFFSAKQANDAIQSLQGNLRDSMEDNAKNIEKFLKDYSREIQEVQQKGKDAEAQKMWERIQEEIQNTIPYADAYIAKLEQLETVQERVAGGAKVLSDQARIDQQVEAQASKVSVTQDGWFQGGLLYSEGLAEQAKDYAGHWREMNAVLSETKLKYADVDAAMVKIAQNMTSTRDRANALSETFKINYDEAAKLVIKWENINMHPEFMEGNQTYSTANYDYIKQLERTFNEGIKPALESMHLKTAEEVQAAFNEIKEQIKSQKPELAAALGSAFDVSLENYALNFQDQQLFDINIDNFKDKLNEGNAYAQSIWQEIHTNGAENFKEMTQEQFAEIVKGSTAAQARFEMAQTAVQNNLRTNTEGMKTLLQEIKAEAGATFEDMSEEQFQAWIQGAEGEKVVERALANIRDTQVPWVYNAIVDMVNKSNRLRIVIPLMIQTYNVGEGQGFDEVSKDFFKHFVGTNPRYQKGLGPLSPQELDRREAEWKNKKQAYARYQKKQNQTDREWKKSLNETYNDELSNLKFYGDQVKKWQKGSQMYNYYYEKQQDAQKQVDTIKDIAGYEHFTLELKGENKPKKTSHKKTGKDPNKEANQRLAEAIKEEITFLKDVTRNYKELTKNSVPAKEAIKQATAGFDASVAEINKVFAEHGLEKLDLELFAGKDTGDIIELLEKQQAALRKLDTKRYPAVAKAIEAIDIEIRQLRVSAKTYDMEQITTGLQEQLAKTKEEYDMAVEINADPELANLFGDMFGISLKDLPKDARAAIERIQDLMSSELDTLYGNNAGKMFDVLASDLDKFANAIGIEKDSTIYNVLKEAQGMARELIKSEFVETEKMLNDYLDKYGSFSDKVAQADKDRLANLKKLNDVYNTEALRQTSAYLQKKRAIEQGYAKEYDKIMWESFKDSHYYTELFENMEHVSGYALDVLKEKLNDLKSGLAHLSPTDFKTLLEQIEKVEKESLERNPFKGLGGNIVKGFNAWFSRAANEKKADSLQSQIDGEDTILEELKLQKNEMEAQGKIGSKEWKNLDDQIRLHEKKREELESQLDTQQRINQENQKYVELLFEQVEVLQKRFDQDLKAVDSFTNFMQETLGVDLGDVWNSFLDGAKLADEGLGEIKDSILQMASGNFISGGIGLFTGLGKTVAGIWDGIASIFGGGSAKTKRLDRQIKRSEQTVHDLQNAYKNLEVQINKTMGSGEFQARRLAIANKKAELTEIEYQKRLEESKRKKDRDSEKIQQYEDSINDLRREIDELADDVANTLLGTDVKSAAEDFVDTWLEAWKEGEDAMDSLSEKFDDMIDTMIKKAIASRVVGKYIEQIWKVADEITSEQSEGGAEVTMNELQRLKALTGDKSVMERINEELKALYTGLGITFGSGSGDKELSALQQGIQGITEDTAGAIEAYMNGVSQQVYLHSELLTQIRDALALWDSDVEMATNAQILFQLQQSYQIQVAIQNILGGWSNPSGMAVRVQMV